MLFYIMQQFLQHSYLPFPLIPIVFELENEIPKLYSSASNYKNVEVILDKYKLACIYFMSEGKKNDYINILKFIDDARKKARNS